MNEIKTTAEAYESTAIPRCNAAIVVDGAAPTVEQKPLPEAVLEQGDKSPAEWAYERLILYIQTFEEQLDSEHEVGMGIAGADVGAVQIQGIGFFAPDMVTFYGADDQGGKVQLVQHVSQLNVMLIASPKTQSEARRIGFRMVEQLEEQVKEATIAKK